MFRLLSKALDDIRNCGYSFEIAMVSEYFLEYTLQQQLVTEETKDMPANTTIRVRSVRVKMSHASLKESVR